VAPAGRMPASHLNVPEHTSARSLIAMKKRYYIITTVSAYLLFLLATIPAQFITDNISKNAPVTIQGVSGSLWNGRAYLITVDNSVTLNNTKWSFSAWKLLIGQLAVDMTTHYAGNDIETELGTSFLGRYFVNDLSAALTANDLAQLANIPLAQLSGRITLNIEQAQWQPGELPLATGEIKWQDATVTVVDTASLGNVTIVLGESEQQQLIAAISNQGGDLAVEGTVELIPEADYSLDITLTPTASANNNIKQSLGMFAKRLANGEYQLKKSGSLNQLGLM
jgi:general secretion pathway protein N